MSGIFEEKTDFRGEFSPEKANFSVAEKFFTRWEHGQDEVRVWTPPKGRSIYELKKPTGAQFFKSRQKLVQEITGREKGPSFKTYFRVGAVNLSQPNVLTLLDSAHSKVVVDAPRVPTVLKTTEVVTDVDPAMVALLEELEKPWRDGKLSNEKEAQTLAREILDELDPPTGIDIEGRSHEVRKLLFAGFRGKMMSQNYDPEEVLQQVLMGLHTRNNGKCPWDRRKSTFGYYVHMVINGVLTNYHRKQTRRIDRDYIPMDVAPMIGDMGRGTDAGVADDMALAALRAYFVKRGNGPDNELALKIMMMAKEGMARREIVAVTGHTETRVSRALAHLRKMTKEWALEEGLR